VDEPAAPPDDDDAPAPPGARSSARWAIATFLVGTTLLAIPFSWWRVTYTVENLEGADVADTRLWSGAEPMAHPWATILTGCLLAAAMLLLFVRLAARSFRLEPAAWRRDVAVATLLLVATLASTLLWPADVPTFWGGRTYTIDDPGWTGGAVTEVAMPVWGWWFAVVATACAAVAWWKARRGDNPEAQRAA
jgi:hypothetical protein